MISNEPLFLECPFREKDEVKKLGAKFDGTVKKWFIPPGVEIEQFRRWLPQPLDQSEPLNLYELLAKVKETVERQHACSYWVWAEVVNISHHKGHVYVELSHTHNEQTARARGMIWNDRAKGVLQKFELATEFPFKAGIQVLLQVSVELHLSYGLSLLILDIDPNFTLGDLEAKLNHIRARLKKEGLYTQNKQFPIPTEFCKVAVIAPPQGAGLGDLKSQADKLTGLCQFYYYYATFQGQNTVIEIPQAIELVNQDHQHHHFDALVIIRGGGAKGDLYQLNEYSIAQAICTAKLPVIVGIGHERDHTLLDEVAQQSYPTPSLTIAHMTHTIVQNARQAKYLWQVILKFSSDLLNQAKINNERLSAQIREQSMNLLNEQRLDVLMQSIQQMSEHRLIQARQHVRFFMEQVLLGDPKRVLHRGYVIVRNEAHQVMTTRAMALRETVLRLEFKDGQLVCQVEQEDKNV